MSDEQQRMSADPCIVFYDLSFTLADARMQAARGAGLQSYWGAFGMDREHNLLFIGHLQPFSVPNINWRPNTTPLR